VEVLRGVAATLRFPDVGGDPAAFTSAVTLTIVRDSDGSTVVSEGSATKVEGDPDYWTYTLAAQDEVDLLNVTWSDGASTYTMQVEVVGGFVSPLSDIEAKLGEETDAPEYELRAKREVALQEIENACGVAFRPRYAKETISGSGTNRLVLPHRQLLRVIAVEAGGVALSGAEVEALVIDPIGVVVRDSGGWPAGRSNITVTYVHGYLSYVPAQLPVRDLAAYLLTTHPTDWNERATGFSGEMGSYSLVTPGVRGARFPLPSVNAFVEQHGAPLVA
jgi:hypothetical protein